MINRVLSWFNTCELVFPTNNISKIYSYLGARWLNIAKIEIFGKESGLGVGTYPAIKSNNYKQSLCMTIFMSSV